MRRCTIYAQLFITSMHNSESACNIHLIRFVQQFMKLKFFIYHIWYLLYMYLITKPYQIYIRV